MAALPASAEAPRPVPPTPAAGDEPDRLEGKSEDRSSGSSNAESLDRLLPPVGAGRSPRKRTTSQCKSEPPLLRTSKRTIYTAGRPPWYNEHGTQSKEAFAIGLGGGSASGKTTVARMIIEALDVPWVVLLSMDSFYKVLTRQQQEQAAHNNFNFDHPDAFDFDLIISTLKKLKQGKSVKVPIYDFTTHSRKKDWKTLYGANVIIFEGIMAFADKTLLELLDMKIFVDTDSDIRLVRRLRRDISERGRDIEGVIKQYNKFVKPAFDQYIQPTMRVADIVVPRGSGNTVAIDLIVQHVHSQLEERELSVRGSCAGICEDRVLWPWCCLRAVCPALCRLRPAPPSPPPPPRPTPLQAGAAGAVRSQLCPPLLRGPHITWGEALGGAWPQSSAVYPGRGVLRLGSRCPAWGLRFICTCEASPSHCQVLNGEGTWSGKGGSHRSPCFLPNGQLLCLPPCLLTTAWLLRRRASRDGALPPDQPLGGWPPPCTPTVPTTTAPYSLRREDGALREDAPS
ncbi:uridine-cytidine kinase-like 1 isoform X7 [Delphinapterus leucas]|uniref:Uridine-cytidine kinase n=1 Tax=Delphinapterus leucas TaxID=9749 RepID=A0A2Y9Q6L9_DELLE|nr:uridine-cytidine kinase-like 1 isoform X7 [Delphinapterus leucas]